MWPDARYQRKPKNTLTICSDDEKNQRNRCRRTGDFEMLTLKFERDAYIQAVGDLSLEFTRCPS